MESKEKFRIAVIIVGFRSRQYLDDCLGSLKATKAAITTYFIDNGSSDGSAEHIRAHYPEVVLTVSETNLGFATANNQVWAEVQKKPFDAVLLLNPDTVVDLDLFKELEAHYDENTIIQPLVLLHKDGKATQKINTEGNPLHYLGFSYAGGNETPLTRPTDIDTIPLASGAAVLIPVKALKKVGLFDDRFFCYHEDTDLSYRFHLAGYAIKCVRSAKVWHKYHFSRNTGKFYYLERNRHWVLLKNFQIKTLIIIAPMFLLTELFMLLNALLGGWIGGKLRAYWDEVHYLPEILRKRRTTQALRTISDKQLYPLITATLSFSEVDGTPVHIYNLLSKAYWNLVKHL